jgi:hypothetical protein
LAATVKVVIVRARRMAAAREVQTRQETRRETLWEPRDGCDALILGRSGIASAGTVGA